MLFSWLIKLRWKEASRSNVWQRNVAANIVIGFMLFLLISELLLLGVFLNTLLKEMFPEEEPVFVFNSILVYYFLFDLLIRYLMQGLPTFNVESFLHLPVKRSSVVHYVLMRTGFHIINLLPLLVFVPFAVVSLPGYFESSQWVGWLVSIISLVLMNCYLATWLKRQLVTKPWITGTIALAMVLVAVADYFGFVKLTLFSSAVFDSILMNPILVLVPIVLLLTFYLVQYRFLLNRMYPDEVIKSKSHGARDIPRIRYLESLGLTGDLMMLEMKLWWRHKRTKSMLYLLPIFLLYGLFFYPQPSYRDQTGWLIFVGIFMSGGFMMNYLNYAFGYESNYFDGILTRKIDMSRYIQAKMAIGMTITSFCFIITVPYVFFGADILLINLATFLFNMGFLSFLLTYMATYNKLRMDLSKGSAFNYQGIGAKNWLVLFPAFLFPVIIYAPFGLMGYKYIGLAFIALIGIAGLLFRKVLIKKITENFFHRKYIMAEGFRGN